MSNRSHTDICYLYYSTTSTRIGAAIYCTSRTDVLLLRVLRIIVAYSCRDVTHTYPIRKGRRSRAARSIFPAIHTVLYTYTQHAARMPFFSTLAWAVSVKSRISDAHCVWCVHAGAAQVGEGWGGTWPYFEQTVNVGHCVSSCCRYFQLLLL